MAEEQQIKTKKRMSPGLGCVFSLATMTATIYAGLSFGFWLKADIKLIDEGQGVEITEHSINGIATYTRRKDSTELYVYRMFGSSFWFKDTDANGTLDKISNGNCRYHRTDEGIEELFRRADKVWAEYHAEFEPQAQNFLKQASKKPEDQFDF